MNIFWKLMWISLFGMLLGEAAQFLPIAVLWAVLFSVFGSLLVFLVEKDRPLGFMLAVIYLLSLVLTFAAPSLVGI